MASIKELRLKVRSLKNTNKITSAMKLVATSKLRRAQEAAKANEPYALKIREVLARVASAASVPHPMLVERPVRAARFYVFSSDKGLCGSFNNALFKFLNQAVYSMEESSETGDFDVRTFTIGRKAMEYVSRRDAFGFQQAIDGLSKEPDIDVIDRAMREALADYMSGKVDAVYMVFNHYVNVMKQEPTIMQVLPVQKLDVVPVSDTRKSVVEAEYLLEPSQEGVLDELVPLYLSSQFYQCLLETQVGEFAARMTAMEAATKNSKELIRKQTLIMNRLRQAAITTELTEIVAGAESLND
jgi:F-type H+-transporting ATPase subunit gamma